MARSLRREQWIVGDMSDMDENYWRRRAIEAEAIAEVMRRPEHVACMHQVAAAYEKLADLVDREKRAKVGGSGARPKAA